MSGVSTAVAEVLNGKLILDECKLPGNSDARVPAYDLRGRREQSVSFRGKVRFTARQLGH